jgi:DDE superfamily endonuclease
LLLRTWFDITAAWRPAFGQQRSFHRALCQALGTLTTLGRRTLSRVIAAQGRQQQDWTAEYRLHSRAQWRVNDLFQPILEKAVPLCRGRYLAMAVDDTRIHKTGRKILSAFYQRDPLSPKFRFNLMWGLRFLQVALLLPLYRASKQSARSLPMRFLECPVVKKPAKKAPQAEWGAWREHRKLANLSTRSVEILRDLRQACDAAGGKAKTILGVGDNSFCNRTLFRANWERIHIIARARRDVKLCRPATGGRRIYAQTKFTPEDIRQDENVAWCKVRVFYGGQWRKIRYKQVAGIYWQSGAGQKLLRLFVLAPLPYRAPGRKRKDYRDPAFLLTTDLTGSPRELLQPYLDRWQIEVNHREEKDTLGIGQAQLRSPQSVPRQPAFVVAAYSALLLAGILAYGPDRGAEYPELPKWRRNAKRPSCLDLITVLRKEMTEQHAILKPLGLSLEWQTLVSTAAA